LREYFDAGVERVTAEDVMARVRVNEAGLQPLETTRNLKPAWAAVGAFAVTLLGLGGLASVLKVAPRVTGATGADPAEVVGVGEGTISVWLIAAVVAAVVAGAAVWLVYRSAQRAKQESETGSERGKVRVMETMEQTGTEESTEETTDQKSRWSIVVIVVLALAAVGLVAWMALGMRPNSPNAAPPEIVELMDDYTAAFNAYDADALEALVTPGYRIHSEMIDQDLEGVRSYLFPQFESWGWHVTGDGPYYAVDNGGTWYVTNEGSAVTRSGQDHPQLGMWRIAEHADGSLKIADHYFQGG